MIPKFRAWDKKDNRMLQHTLFETWWYTLAEDDETGHARATIPVQSQSELKSRLIPMQSTGLKTKEGNEIFGGDILHGTYESSSDPDTPTGNVVVKFGEDGCCWAGNELLHEFLDYDNVKIVGNIHKNPEMVSKKVTKGS